MTTIYEAGKVLNALVQRWIVDADVLTRHGFPEAGIERMLCVAGLNEAIAAIGAAEPGNAPNGDSIAKIAAEMRMYMREWPGEFRLGRWADRLDSLDSEPVNGYTTDLRQVVTRMAAEMTNFADVADRCQLTEGNASVAIRVWRDQLLAETDRLEANAAVAAPAAEPVAHRWIRKGAPAGEWHDGPPTERQAKFAAEINEVSPGLWTPQLAYAHPAPAAPALPDGFVGKLLEIRRTLDKILGDTDPPFGDDMADEDIRDESPVWWSVRELTAMIAASEGEG